MGLKISGKSQEVTAEGNGPVDATFNAIKKLVPHNAILKLYQVSAVTQGTDAQVEVTVRLESPEGNLYNGRGVDIDIMVASAQAYVSALVKLQTLQERTSLLPKQVNQ